MSLFNVFDVAGSAMTAQSMRLNLTASNLANAESVGSSPGQTYHARYPVFASTLQDAFNEGAAAGVRVSQVVTSTAPPRAEYRPEHPAADAQGNVYYPNVNVVEEMANMISASRNYQNSVEVLNTTKQMMQRTLALAE